MLKMVTRGYLKGNKIKSKLVNTFKNESGQGFGEYGMILVLVLVIAVPLIVSFREELSDVITTITTAIGTR